MFIMVWEFSSQRLSSSGFRPRGIHPTVYSSQGRSSHRAFIPRGFHPRAIRLRGFHPRGIIHHKSIHTRGIRPSGHSSHSAYSKKGTYRFEFDKWRNKCDVKWRQCVLSDEKTDCINSVRIINDTCRTKPPGTNTPGSKPPGTNRPRMKHPRDESPMGRMPRGMNAPWDE